MKKSLLVLTAIFLLTSAGAAQNLPNAIKNYLDANYTSDEDGRWSLAPGACDGNKSLLSADFDGDGKTDYLVRLKTGKTAKTSRIYLIAFFNRNGEYVAKPFYESAYTDVLLNSASSIIAKGTTIVIELGAEGEGPSMALPNPGIAQQVCGTDGVATFVYKNGEIKNVKDLVNPDGLNIIARQDSVKKNSAQNAKAPIITPAAKKEPAPKQNTTGQPASATVTANQPAPQATVANVIPDLTGDWKILSADGKTAADTTGTISYEGNVIVFEIKAATSQKRATAYAEEGKIHTGWKTVGTVSPDGKTISWSDKTSWVRK